MGYENLYCFFFYQIYCWEKVYNLQNFCSRSNKVFMIILIFLFFFIFFSNPGIRHSVISIYKVLAPIKVLVLVKNSYFGRPKFKFHAFQQVNGFLYCHIFYRKETCLSHKLIFRLIRTWIWFDLLTVIHFWPLNHQLFYSFYFLNLK